MKTIKLVLVILFCIAIASCGGGGSGGGTSTTTQTLSGTAAQGAAIASATVTIKDKNGSTITGTTGTDGKYSIDVTGKTAPFLLKVPAGAGFLYSVATATGAANIHPFTDLIIRNWYKVQSSDVETDFSGAGALAKVPTVAEINTIEAVIRNILSANLTNVGVTASNFNLLTSSFVADHTGFDKVLDNTRVAVSTTGAVTVTATDPTTGISGTMVSADLTTDLSVADTAKPSDPTGLSAIPASATSIVLVWNATTDNVGVAGYNIYRGATKVGTSPYPVYSDTGLTSGSYCYQVEAIDGAGNVSAAKSASVCATPAADTTAPSAPTVLTATVASASQIDLSWTASTSTDVAGYAIYRDTIKVAAVNGTSYSDMGLSSGTLYSYTVKAMDGALNYSVASNSASATPATPTVTVDATGTWTVTVISNAGSGTFTMNLIQSGSSVSGTVTIMGYTGNLSGSITGSNISLTFPDPQPTCSGSVGSFTGTVSGNTMSGSQTSTAGGTCPNESGTWTATKVATIGTAFPIANTSTHEISSGAAFDGTNFLVGIGDKPLPPDPTNANQSVTAQLVSKTGALVGPRITTGATGGGDPWVAFGGGNYLLVWEQGAGGGISGQLVDTSGALVGVPFAIATPTIGTKNNMGFRPVIFDGTNFLVAWFNFNSTTGNGDTADMFGQFITPNGALLGSVIPISTAVHGQRFPALAFDGANILAIWADGRNQSACDTSCYESDVYGQFITKSGASAAGVLSGSNFLISAGTLPRDNPVSIAFDGTNYLVTFVEETTLPNACPVTGCNWEAYGILVTKAGAPTGSRFVIGNTTARAKMFPSPNYLGTQYLVTWSDGMGTTSASVKGQFVTTSGAVSGTEFTLFSPAASGALPYFGVVVTGGGVNLAITEWGIPDATDTSNMDLTTSADVMGSIVTFP